MSNAIESSIKRSRWKDARRLIRSELRRDPRNHWLLTRLSLTYYEQKNYRIAHRFSLEALRLAPYCPLVLWDHAGSLDMLGRKREAIALYRRLIRRGVRAIAIGRCGEGTAWARALVADCYYRLAACLADVSQLKQAAHPLRRHLEVRGPGCHSIYPISLARTALYRIQERERVA